MAGSEVAVLGIGAGPANLALAVALEELAPELAGETLLVEQSESTVWQRGLLIPWAQSQVSFLKDLATLRNPRSRFTFVNYLHETGRLDDFMSLGTFTPYRSEISDYLQWVVASLERVRVQYNRRAVRIDPVRDASGALSRWDVLFSDGSQVSARHLVVAGGRDPRIPEVFQGLPAERVVHSSEYSVRIAELPRDVPQRVVVIGGAQSAVEMVQAVRQDVPNCSPVLVVRGIGLTPYVSSKFTSRFYSAAASEEFFELGPEGRELVLAEMARSNYSGVTPELLDSLYHQMYRDRLDGKEGLRVLTATDVVTAVEEEDCVVLTLRDRRTGLESELRCDRVLLGTGYEPSMPAGVRRLGDELGLTELEITRNYRVRTAKGDGGPTDGARLYLQGVNESTHGIADSLLSTMATRAADIVTDLLSAAGE
ncbi:SidA/IucD/PvdA family monooxygenase [Streptomyces sp. NBC_00190]|uniref:SidA/IucD/PvdA family monooxygenase n=1 Tax=Streptomyces sp. NBC_00190 TaxID=2903634 RepID=UPI002E2E2655|nr:SidA/IucD/PvdA family monooxygenase [Streptomyces sp. NBC_00190]